MSKRGPPERAIHRDALSLRRCCLVAFVLLLALAGCQFPSDVEGTLDRVEDGTLRVGVVDDPPWVDLASSTPRGVEPTLIRRFADSLNAEVEWIRGAESDLVDGMAGFQLDVIIGGLDRQWPYGLEVALTRPYVDTEIEIGVPPGFDLPDDLGGERIWVERNSTAAALLKQEEEDAIPVFYDHLGEIEGPALLETYEIAAIGYDRTDYILRDDEHAMATPMGENAFLIELEHFLLDRGEEAEDLLHRIASRDVAAREKG
jgi:polar amino acid transport system substrate-binding protein